MCRATETPIERIRAGVADLPSWTARQHDAAMFSEPLIEMGELIDRLEAARAELLRRFEKSGAWRADGTLSVTAWLRWKCKLSGGAAAERVGVARQLEKLPQTEQAFNRGEVGYQHVALIARTAENVGTATVRKAEAQLLQAAQTMDPGRFAGVTKDFEHRVDAEGALAEANRAYARRYLHLGEPRDGLMRIDGLLDAEGGATVQTALNAFMKPGKDDDRTPGQRRHDALVEVCQRRGAAHPDGAGQRPQLIITASVDTLAGVPGAPAARLESGATIPSATAQRLACDAAITRITGLGEFDHEISKASRSIPPSTRRALAARDRHCVFAACDRPPAWCDGHHLIFWTRGGPTTLPNLALVCRPHHRKVHEEGWTLKRRNDGQWIAMPPPGKIPAHARSA
jgi:hypothetical protein